MKAFIVLALCCSFFSSRAIPLAFEFLDCDDPDVFKAVDAALKKFNGDRTTGNQFALYMVMEAKRTAGPDPEFHVKYRILESNCTTEENKHWQDCQYKVSAEAKTGECTARVYMNDADKTTNVSQECKIFSDVSKIRLSKAPCLGCSHRISSDGPEVSEILKKAIQKFNKHSGELALFKLVEIKEAKRQVLNGWEYKINYEIEETNCSKDQFQDLTPECRITSRGRVAKCEAKAFQNLQAEIMDIASDCKLPVEETVVAAICPGCPRTIPSDSPELKELLKLSIEKYNLESDDEFYYKAGEILSATVQMVAGKKYQIKFSVGKTNCSKSEFEKLNEDCVAIFSSELLSCNAEIHVIPWQNKIFPQVNCSEYYGLVATWGRLPPGFTPFRSSLPLSEEEEVSYADNNGESQSPIPEIWKDDGQEPEGKGEPEHKHRHKHRHGVKKDRDNDQRHRHDIGCGHRSGHGCGHKKHSKKNKHPNPRSSEESHERGFNQNETHPSSSAETALQLVSTGVAREETSRPAEPLILPDTSLFNGLPGLPEPPRPRCPGKSWKQLVGFLAPPSFPREFRNEDLLPSAAENIDPATENNKEDFDLTDALA
ncbi:PREDICTED: kininogen-1 isoform X1 [Pseudopodoces humilis]|uniref:kininogen-1 isoform X1 n=1 Tax=Pseudopodoces humilis TaxID=181119 RepID=UPI000395C00A|nr:PREDICTED: kininogen-1 isoform X1 [Pseudopodoces humilis]